MTNRYSCTLIGLMLLTAPPAGGQETRPDTPPWRLLLKATEREQLDAVKATLDQGFPPDNYADILLMNRPALLPVVEAKIEQVLHSKSASECFTVPNVDSKRFVIIASSAIAQTGGAEALHEIAKLLTIDRERFQNLVEFTLDSSDTYSKSRNPFVVAYHALDSEDNPELRRLIIAWVEKNASVDPAERRRAAAAARPYGLPGPPPSDKTRRLWAAAMLDRYGDVLPERLWANDPILSKLHEPLKEEAHREIPRLAREIWERGRSGRK